MFIYQRVYIKLSKIDQGDITMSGGNSTYSTGAVIDPATFDWKKKNFCSTWSNRKAARKIANDTMKPDEEVCFELPIYVGWKISAWLLVEIFLHKRYYLLFHVICSKEDKLLTVGHPVSPDFPLSRLNIKWMSPLGAYSMPQGCDLPESHSPLVNIQKAMENHHF